MTTPIDRLKKRSEELQAQILKVKPSDPFAREMQGYWSHLKRENDALIHAIMMATNPEERKKERTIYQRLHKNSPRQKQLDKILSSKP